MELITVYFRPYTYQVGPYKAKGTEYFKDKECQVPFCKNPYVCRRKNHIVTVDEWRFNAIKVD